MKLVEDILNAKNFEIGSRDRLKATIISLVLLLAIFIMIVDIYESIIDNHIAISIIEGGSALIFIVTYALFPKKLSLISVIYIALYILSFLFIISLTIEGANPKFALFWLATLPIYYFFFLGLKQGTKWSIGAIVALLFTTLNAYIQWYPPLYSSSFLLQITIAYITISYLLYVLEKERQGYEDGLEHSIKDREVLLKEVHHRTKNNMQIMIGLLDRQSFKIKDIKYKNIFQAHINRITSMATIHEHLYSGDNFESVEMQKYLGELITNFQNLTRHNIIANISPLLLDMKNAINLSLIFNEALTNAIDYAYSDNESGIIEVSFVCSSPQEYILQIKDYGKGFDTTKEYNTLGMSLMQDISQTLSTKSMEIDTSNGTQIKFYYTKDK